MTLHSERVSKPLVRTDIFLSDFQRDTLKSLAAAQDITAAELTRRILEKYLRRELKKQAAIGE
jgi:hypothetical protein